MDDNVVLFPGLEINDALYEDEGLGPQIPMDELIEGLKEQDFKELVIIGKVEEGTYFASTSGNPAEVLFALEKAKYILMNSYFSEGD
jgi:hypothetical protein